MIRLLLIAVLASAPAFAQTGVDPDDVTIEIAFEPRAHRPHPGEMILLSIRGTYRLPVILESLVQPDLPGFDWMQLGEDRWTKTRAGGFEVLNFERRMALFPQQAGRLDVAPFTHELKLLSRRGWPVETRFVSNTAHLDVVPGPATDGWWFPVRRLEISDSWSNAPEELAPGQSALRIVTLTVDGAAPQRIPPMPEMTGAGAHIFASPEHKITALGPDGPVTRVFWRWTVRPHQDGAGYLNPITLSYFDSEARETREITLSAQRVAHAGAPVGPVAVDPVKPPSARPTAAETPETARHLPGWALLIALVAGLSTGLAPILWRLRKTGSRLPGWLAIWQARRALNAAIRAGAVCDIWRHARALMAARGQRDPGTLAHLDRLVFGPDSTPDRVADFARTIARGRHRS